MSYLKSVVLPATATIALGAAYTQAYLEPHLIKIAVMFSVVVLIAGLLSGSTEPLEILLAAGIVASLVTALSLYTQSVEAIFNPATRWSAVVGAWSPVAGLVLSCGWHMLRPQGGYRSPEATRSEATKFTA